jgi:ribonuclease T2
MTLLFLIIIALYLFSYTIPTLISPDYDMYVFSIQWGPTLCEDNQECKDKIKSIPKNIFTLHGLWPSYRNGKMIEECNKGELINVKITEEDLLKEMLTFWISYTSDNQNFWNHEYNKHGYCYSERYKQYNPDNFFNKSMSLYNQYSLTTYAKSTKS